MTSWAFLLVLLCCVEKLKYIVFFKLVTNMKLNVYSIKYFHEDIFLASCLVVKKNWNRFNPHRNSFSRKYRRCRQCFVLMTIVVPYSNKNIALK